MTTQQTIDDANSKLSAAQAAYDSALASQSATRQTMQDWFNLTNQCFGIGNGTVGQKFNRDNCHHGNSGPCQAVSTCKGNVDSYNSTVDNYNTASANVVSKKSLLDAAIAYKDSVIKNAQNDPTFIAQQQQNQNASLLAQKQLDEQKAKTRNIAIAITIIVVVIVIGFVIWKK